MSLGLEMLSDVSALVHETFGRLVQFRDKKVTICIRQTAQVWPEDSSLWEQSDLTMFIPISVVNTMNVKTIPQRDERVTLLDTGEVCKIVSANQGGIDYIVAMKTYRANV